MKATVYLRDKQEPLVFENVTGVENEDGLLSIWTEDGTRTTRSFFPISRLERVDYTNG